MKIDLSVLRQVSDELQRYVYALVDPSTSIPFYVGKGRGLRHAQHLAEVLNSEDEPREEASRKREKIQSLLDQGLEPEVWILRYGLTDSEYTAVEAVAIDLLMSFPIARKSPGSMRVPLSYKEQLRNARREDARGHGLTLLESLIDEYAAPELTTQIPLLLITLNSWVDLPEGETIAGGRLRTGAGFKQEWLVRGAREAACQEIGESASAWWTVSQKNVEARGIEHFAVLYRGVTRGLYKIDHDSWQTVDGGTSKSGAAIRKSAFWFEPIRSGLLFDEIVGPHGHRVTGRAKGAQNAIYYWPRP